MPELKIGGILDSSTIDYRGRVCSVIYLCGCSFRCGWCQNRDLILENNCKTIGIDAIVEKLRENFIIDSVCITGGEPLMQGNTVELLKRIKRDTNLLTKIDTNLCFPDVLKRALPYLDFISVDIKAELTEKYKKLAGISENIEEILGMLEKSLVVLEKWDGEKEARTTVIPGLIDKRDIEEIVKIVKRTGFDYYTLQQFRPVNTLNPEFEKIQIPKREEMLKLGKIAKRILPKTRVQIVTQKNGFEEIT
ncbi:MAG TPA: anaerobic ribonucleoside-triphosphate reductase activating protein [Candidatus Altiarchaeales archaeon]|nr:anaerobic ribonucleoside-triphosphate reductase activating protein [Candidatus Altiarchaeales archaeon]